MSSKEKNNYIHVSRAKIKFTSSISGIIEGINEFPKMYHSYKGEQYLAIGSTVSIQDRTHNFKQLSNEIFSYTFPADLNTPVWFGGLSFYPKQNDEEHTWRGFSAQHFFIPKVLLRISTTKSELIAFSKESKEKAKAVLQTFQKKMMAVHKNQSEPTLVSEISERTETDLISLEQWKKQVKFTLESIEKKKISKIVLVRGKRINISNYEFSISETLHSLNKKFPECIIYAFQVAKNSIFFGATPEILFETSSGSLQTMALAGSINRGSSDLTDQILTKQMFASIKLSEEHNIVVNYLKKNLSKLCDEIVVSEKPDALKLNNIQHLRTRLSGELKSQKSVFDIIKEFHPTPAVGGMPPKKAITTLGMLETFDRGWYSGTMGIISPNNDALFGVNIRGALSLNNGVWMYAGAGIVKNSHAEDEWKEVELKFLAVYNSLYYYKKNEGEQNENTS